MDGDGWTECGCGERHWGRYGAAGTLVAAHGSVLLQHRAPWSSYGGSWGIPGGARGQDEPAVEAALRETEEETALPGSRLRLAATSIVQHEGWSYTTVLAEAPEPLPVTAADAESDAVLWVPIAEVERRPLHPAFGAAFPVLRPALGLRTVVVVDAANVVGSRPDGWWRDRAGAAERLLSSTARWVASPLPEAALPPACRRPALTTRYVEAVVVLEGAARAASTPAEAGGPVQVRRADASGDEAIVEAVVEKRRAAAPVDLVVVTADRALGDRVREVGAAVVGPGWLRDQWGER